MISACWEPELQNRASFSDFFRTRCYLSAHFQIHLSIFMCMRVHQDDDGVWCTHGAIPFIWPILLHQTQWDLISLSQPQPPTMLHYLRVCICTLSPCKQCFITCLSQDFFNIYSCLSTLWERCYLFLSYLPRRPLPFKKSHMEKHSRNASCWCHSSYQVITCHLIYTVCVCRDETARTLKLTHIIVRSSQWLDCVVVLFCFGFFCTVFHDAQHNICPII